MILWFSFPYKQMLIYEYLAGTTKEFWAQISVNITPISVEFNWEYKASFSRVFYFIF
jgi:hypothetical protein